MANPKRIGIDARIWRSSTGGIGRYARNLVNELARLDRENQYTVIITPEDKKEYSLEAPNFQPLVVDIAHYSYAEQIQLPRLLGAHHFDLVHFTQFNHPLMYRGKFVVTVHDLIMHLYPSGKQTKSLLHKLAYQWVMNDTRRANAVIVPSVASKNDLVSMLGFPAAKIIVTPEGSESGFGQASAAEINHVRAKYNLPARYLLYVSRWEHYKGLPILLKAFERLSRNHPELGLVICGRPVVQSPQVTAQVHEAQARNPLVITPGFVSDEDLAPLYSGASAYVHPSWYEGFGIMILEAFAAGAPVVTSNTSSLPEVVGNAGLMVDPRNIDELTAAISTMLNDPAQANDFRKKGFDRVKQYSWEKMAEQTLGVYRHILGTE